MSTLDISIPETYISTADSNEDLSICSGKGIYPPFPSIGAGVSINGVEETLFKHHFKLLAVKGTAGFTWGINIGLCGPGYAVGMDAKGEVVDNTLFLEMTDDEWIGGLILGVDASAGIEFTASVYRWHHWKFSWSNKLNIDARFEMDLVKAIIDILGAAVGLESFLAITEPVNERFTTSLAVYDRTENEMEEQNTLQIGPKAILPVNLWPVLVAAAQIGDAIGLVEVGASVLVVDKILNYTLSHLSFGPQLTLVFPIDFEIKKIALDDAVFHYEKTEHGMWQGTASDNVSEDPEHISLHITHYCDFDFGIGAYAEVQLLEIFHIGASVDLDILAVLNLDWQIMWFEQELKTKVGHGYSNRTQSSMSGHSQKVEVEFV